MSFAAYPGFALNDHISWSSSSCCIMFCERRKSSQEISVRKMNRWPHIFISLLRRPGAEFTTHVFWGNAASDVSSSPACPRARV